jgi:ABC-2 type transport system ATP-binding protein
VTTGRGVSAIGMPVGAPVIEAHGLTKRYAGRRGSGGVVAVDGVDLVVRRGEVYGFLGPNGAGKTTTLRMLLGLVRPTSGDVAVLGRRPGHPHSLAATGSMIEGPAFYPFLTGRANLRMMARYAGVPEARVSRALAEVDLAGRADDRFARYSLGMKQRLGVAAALLKDPTLVVLDEPSNGLDPAGMRDMRALIRGLGDAGRTVILSSHVMAEVQQVCDRVAVIDAGRIVVDGSVAELRGGGELVVVAAPHDVAERVLDAMPQVRRVARQDDGLRVSVDAAQVPQVVRALVAADVAVSEVRPVARELEDVFLELTGKEAVRV